MLNNSDTRVSGTINNSGTITLKAAGNAVRFLIPGAAGSNTILTGGGSVILDDSLGTNNQITGDSFNTILTNQNNTISGVGNIGVIVIDIVNQSLIDANVPYAVANHFVLLDPTATLTNTGTLRASNGGLLDLGGGTYANAGGTILATGTNSIVQLDNASTVSGGTLATAGGGVIQTAAGTTVGLDSVSNTGNYQFLNNSDTRLFGTINNSGTMTLRAAGNSVRLLVVGAAGTNVTFSGGGNLVLDDSLGTNNQITGDTFGNIFTNQDNTISGAGNIGVNVLDLVNGGVINADRTNTLVIDPTSTFMNNAGGILRGSGTGGLFLAGGTYTNNGTFEALNGSSVFMNTDAALTNNMAGVLTGGRYRAIASGGGATLTIRGVNITQIASATEVDLSGSGSIFQVGTTALETTLTDNSGILRILGNRNYTNTNNLSNEGTIELGGGTFTAPAFTISSSGELFGFGSVTVRPTNSGLIRAVGGTLSLSNGVGSTGTVQIDSTGVLDLSSSAASSAADFLVVNGDANPSLILGAQNFVVALDYTNSHFGAGNTFNPRANVSGAGLINAAGNVGQSLTGSVTNGTAATATMAFGNVHVGDSPLLTYQVNNTGTTGPVLRGALQTSVNGGNITDGRLGGTGVTASNFGPLALGANTGNLAVTFNASSAGALTSQVLHIINNFDNVVDQNLSITGAAYRYANPTTHSPEPVNFGNFHVGDTAPSQALSISNNVPNDSFSEALDASIGGPTGGVTTNGGTISLLAPNATDNTSLVVGIDTASAGNKAGTASITLQSDGTGSSGLGLTTLPSQTVNVTGSVFRLAAPGAHSPEPVTLANQHVGDGVTQAISLTNAATNDGFSEKLDASFTGTTGNATGSGSFTLLGPGATNDTSLLVGVDTSAAGARSGTATIGLVSDGTGTSGLANTTLTSQTVNVSGNVYRLASASTHTPEPVAFGVLHIGDTPSQAISVSNTAVNDAFSEKLDGSIAAATGGVTASGSFSLLAPGSSSNSLSVGINTSSAGNKNGTASIGLVSNGTGTSGLANTDLTSQTVNVTGQVNFFADPVLVFKSGAASLIMNSATSFTLDFGQVAQNSGVYSAAFGVLNTLHDAIFQDSLGGTFDISLVTDFGTSGFDDFSGIAPGGSLDPTITLDSSMTAGSYSNSLFLHATSTNASGTSTLSAITLNLQGTITVPEPNVWAMLMAGGTILVALQHVRRRKL
ncbi:MAG: choice-of-anchor D domain-containing protein [Acidobacteriota bacterium]|nr:choice-of-anchor D domain-containing protein [Acidobacteriota bacterium]